MENQDDKPKKDKRYIASEILPSGEILEMIYREHLRQTQIVVYDGKEVKYVDALERPHETILPYPAKHHLVAKKIVLFPSEAAECGTDKELIDDVQAFIHRYLDVSPRFEKIASYYILFTWVHDQFNELPYLRAIGDFGSGKSRFLRVIGSPCYKPMFTGGATTVSPIFRIIDTYQGTLILDEADFRFSDTTAEVVKIMNSGYQRGTPVLRSEGKGTFEVKSFNVYGPKIVATRETYSDLALESRFLIEEMDRRSLRKDIPINLPDKFEEEALELRNRLLMWRLRNVGKVGLKPFDLGVELEPRLRQIVTPLLSIIEDAEVRKEIVAVMEEYNRELVQDRGLSLYAEVFEALLRLYDRAKYEPKAQEVCGEFNLERTSRDSLTVGRTGYILRKHLKLTLRRKNKGFVVPELENKARIAALKKKFGIPESDVNEVNPVNPPEKNLGWN